MSNVQCPNCKDYRTKKQGRDVIIGGFFMMFILPAFMGMNGILFGALVFVIGIAQKMITNKYICSNCKFKFKNETSKKRSRSCA